MIKKVFILLFSIVFLVGCSSKQKIIDMSSLNLKTVEITYDPQEVNNVRPLDIVDNEFYYLSVRDDGVQDVVVNDSSGNETVILSETNETIETFTKLEDDYYYVGFELSDNFTDASYSLYHYDGKEKTSIGSGFGDVSYTPQLFKFKGKIYTLIQGFYHLETLTVNPTSIYLYNVTDRELVYEHKQENDEVLTLSNHLNGNTKDYLYFSIITEKGHDLKSEVFSFDGEMVYSVLYNNLAISQVSEFMGGQIFTYSVMTGEAMTKKIAYTFENDLKKSDVELSFFEHVAQVEDGLFVYGQIGEHDSEITYYYLSLDEQGELQTIAVELFDYGYGRKLVSTYVNTDDRDYASGKIKFTYISY